MIRKREPHWQSAAERARVAAELIEEAESLTKTGGIASPAEVDRDKLPPPLRLEVPPPPAPPPPPPPPSPPPPAAPQANDEIVKITMQVSRKRLRPNRKDIQLLAGRITAFATR